MKPTDIDLAQAQERSSAAAKPYTLPQSVREFTKKPSQAAKRVLLILPYEMSVRNVVETPVFRLLAERDDIEVTVVSRDDRDFSSIQPGHLHWQPMLRPFRRLLGDNDVSPSRRLVGDIKFILGFYLHMPLTFRFNTLAGFQGFKDRMRQSWRLRRPGLREGLPLLKTFGFPFPKSQSIFAAMRRVCLGAWRRHPLVEAAVDRLRPDLVVLTHLQSPLVVPYMLAATARNIPILGMNGSWDQPTTKGPLIVNPARIVVQSRQVASELVRFHGVAAERLDIVGWPQMDVYAEPQKTSKEALLERMGLPPQTRYILLGAYSRRLGGHEPELCRKLIEKIEEGFFGDNIALVVRCHPLDREWRERLLPLGKSRHVVVEPPSLRDLSHLSALLRHAAVVLSSAGTIGLDAVAVDTPSVALAFEDESQPYYDRAARRFSMEHYAEAVKTGGLCVVRTQAELESALLAYLSDRTRDAEGRARLRSAHLEPLDGGASQRIVEAIVRAAWNRN